MTGKDDKEEQLYALEERTSARGLLWYAEEYRTGYNLIQEQRPGDMDCFSVKYYLLCHSLELVMKALLRHKLVTYKKLRDLGHNLEKLLDEFSKHYKSSLSDEEKSMVLLVNEQYSGKQFEYFVRGAKSVPQIVNLEAIVDFFLLEAKKVINIR